MLMLFSWPKIQIWIHLCVRICLNRNESVANTILATGEIVVRVRFVYHYFCFLFLALNNEYYAFKIMKLHTPNY